MDNQSEHMTRLLREAAHYMDINRFGEARKRYVEILSHYPTKGYVHYRLGNCCYRMGEHDEAIEHCRQALENGYSNPLVYVIIGLSLRLKKRFDEAEATFRDGLELFPTNANLTAQLAFLFWQRKKKKRAQQLIHQARGLDPSNQVVLYYSYFIDPHQKRSGEEPEALRQYIESDATEVHKRILVINELLRTKKYNEALEECRQVFIMDPMNRSVISKLETVERFCSPSFFPNRIIGRMGKWTFLAVLYAAIVCSLFFHEFYVLSILLLVFYAWARCAPWIYRVTMRLQR